MGCRQASRSWSSASCSDNAARLGLVADRCSAAQAECLRKVRDEKTYLKFAINWAEVCVRQLKIGKRTAERAIALLKKHGNLYFETAALTGIAPAEFERSAQAIQRDCL